MSFNPSFLTISISVSLSLPPQAFQFHLILLLSVCLMQPFRRKSAPLFSFETGIMKGRKNNNLSIFVVVFSVILFGIFMYNEDVKSIAEFPFSRSKAQEIQEGTAETETLDPVRKEAIGKTEVHDDSTVVDPVRRDIKAEDGDHETVTVTDSGKSGDQLDKTQEEDSDETQEQIVDSVGSKEKNEKIELPSVKEEEEDEDDEDDEVVELPPEECDLFTGEWVFDNVTHPLYKEEQCEFLTAQVTCMRNGRRDSLYQNWRWQPRDCSMPKYSI